jgi:hypothetical protein
MDGLFSLAYPFKAQSGDFDAQSTVFPIDRDRRDRT